MPHMNAFFALRPSGPGLALGYVLAATLPLALALTQKTAPASGWEYAAAAMGMIALLGMAVQFVTSGRFENLSGRLGIDKIMGFHKLAASWLALAVVLHPLAYIWPTFAADPALGWLRLQFYLTAPAYLSGVVALGALVVLIASSILRDRLPWRYEAWRAVHVVLALVAVAGGLHHAIAVGRFSAQGPLAAFWWAVGAVVLAVMVTLYGWRWAQLRRHKWRLASVTKRADRMWELDIQPASGTPALPYHAGQFVWMTEGTRRFPLFDHPFSISDSPARPGISLLIKEAGDFTNRIGDLPQGHAIGIDGPYGEFSLQAHDPKAVLLIGGGVGIAPVLGILRDMVARGDTRPVRLAYAVGALQNFACLDEMRAATRTLDLRLWLTCEDGAARPDILPGRLTRERLADMLDGLDPAQTKALICGPGPMVVAVSDTLLDLGLPMANVIYERFDYAAGARSRQDRARTRNILAVGGAVAALVAGFTALAGLV
ncbi:ferredoxin reductase family protein [Roseinatronobacter alkalisoli]|uniref:Ferredoxin reductase family protein n=1 Tax=Roseinatronobacter alkalisoli TaxID=3028235 RepID=A0ABT5T9H5_9RHOB|nr:ferredoxin reductase family protein [Roseinatronobacter sp. HJB301]MDD7971770.1 ferredoxin reductase family protein [Roseinatronobacter sp. HJB301]